MRPTKKKNTKISSRIRRKDPIQAAAEYGIDIPMLMANLKRTPEERIRRHQIALDTYWMLRNSKRVEE